jgi:hypothetical protein
MGFCLVLLASASAGAGGKASAADKPKPGDHSGDTPTSLEQAVQLGRLDAASVSALRASGHVAVIATVKYADTLPGAHGRRLTPRDLTANGHIYNQRKAAALAAAGNGVTRRRDYAVLPVIAVDVHSEAALLRLAAAPNVTSVRLSRDNQPLLAQSLPLIRQPQVASAGYRGAGTAVAVLDTGVDYLRSAFGSCASGPGAAGCSVAYAHDFAPDDGSRDDDGHGTNVAGIVVGVAPAAKILALDVFDGSTYSDIDALAAVDWTIANQMDYNVRAMNMSFGVRGTNETLECWGSAYSSAFEIAREAGILPVVAAGNTAYDNGRYSDGVDTPACTPGAVRVGAVYDSNVGSPTFMPPPWTCTDTTTTADQITCFSQSGQLLSLLAPGSEIIAAGIRDSGTSQAAPHVAGAAAVLAAARPDASALKIQHSLVASGPPIPDPRSRVTRHRLDLVDAVANVQKPDAVVENAGCQQNSLAGNDDGSSAIVVLPFSLNFFGNTFSSLYVNNNGNVTFDAPLGIYTPFPLLATSRIIIAPFFADVDTRTGNTVRYGSVPAGSSQFGGHQAFCVDWKDVGFFSQHTYNTNNFQLVLVSRPDTGAGNFDIIFNYNEITWETGDASGGSGGLGGNSARVGYSNGSTAALELPGSAVPGRFLDLDTVHGLVYNNANSPLQPGRYIFHVRNGAAIGHSISGHIWDHAPGAPVSGAFISACPTPADTPCHVASTGADGSYVFSNLLDHTSGGGAVDHAWSLTVNPPAGSSLNSGVAGPISVAGADVSNVDVTLTGPRSIPPDVLLTTPSGGVVGSGTPTTYWGEPITLSVTGCVGGSATATLLTSDGYSQTIPLTALPPGVYTGTFAAPYPHHGSASISWSISCGTTGAFDFYIDPSGVVKTVAGNPVSGATVTLYRSDDPGGPFVEVPDGSALMSPGNQHNPDVTDAGGHFGWDVLPGFYKVRAEKAGCAAPGTGAAYVESDVLSIPPPVTGLDLRLDCGAEKAPGSVSISNIPANAVYGDSFTPTYAGLGDGTPSTASLSPAVCTVAGNVVTFVAAGTCELQASISEGTDYLAATGATQSFTVGKKPAALGFTGNFFWATASATSTSTNVTLSGLVQPVSGGNVDVTKATVDFLIFKSGNFTASPDSTCSASVNASGVASCTKTLSSDNYTVVMRIPAANSYFTAPDSEPVVVTVYQPTTDKYATGGGWIADPSYQNKPVAISPTNNHGNFGFTVKYAKNGSASGHAVYIFRGADGYDYVIKSNSWNGGGLAFGVNSTSFSGKANVTVINPATGSAVLGLGGGNFTYRIDASDSFPDSYALSIYTATGSLYHQAGIFSNQIALGGGQVVVHTR